MKGDIAMMVQTFPKPKIKKHHAKNNPKPTSDDICENCGAPYAQTHEVFEGTGRRQLSIKYGMQVKLCNVCHAAVHNCPELDLELKNVSAHLREKVWRLRAPGVYEVIWPELSLGSGCKLTLKGGCSG
jgi:hypothetical protein